MMTGEAEDRRDSMLSDYFARYARPIEIDPHTACLVIVDMQYATGDPAFGLGKLLKREGRLAEATYRFRSIQEFALPNTKRLLEACRARDVMRIFLTCGALAADYSDLPPHLRTVCAATHNRLGEQEHEIIAELTPMPSELVFNKTTLSGFNSTGIDAAFRSLGVQTLLFTGVATNMCVEHTLRDGADRGFACVLVEDACAADTPAMHKATIVDVERVYGRVMRTADVLGVLQSDVDPIRPSG